MLFFYFRGPNNNDNKGPRRKELGSHHQPGQHTSWHCSPYVVRLTSEKRLYGKKLEILIGTLSREEIRRTDKPGFADLTIRPSLY
jgi:hypothetical protein